MKMPARLKQDADYKAAWRACLKPYSFNSFLSFFGNAYPVGSALDETSNRPDCTVLFDLRVALDAVIKSGWPIAAIKAYAFCEWRIINARCDHVTATAWREAVHSICTGARGTEAFLQRFNADPDHYAFVK